MQAMKRFIIFVFSIIAGYVLATFLAVALSIVGIDIPAMFAKSWSEYTMYGGVEGLLITIGLSWAMYQVLARRFLEKKAPEPTLTVSPPDATAVERQPQVPLADMPSPAQPAFLASAPSPVSTAVESVRPVSVDRARPRWIALAVGIAAVVLLGVGSRIGSPAMDVQPTESGIARVSARPSATASPAASLTATPSPTPSTSASHGQSAAADIAMAIASRTSWVSYTSKTYKFTVKHPVDWTPSETMYPGWATFFDAQKSCVAVTWHAVTKGTKLTTVTDELWKTMHDTGYTVVSKAPGTIEGLPATILVVNGTPYGQPRHGVVGVFIVGAGRYRIELWSGQASYEDDLTLFNTFAASLNAP